jgi:hypothetical protein
LSKNGYNIEMVKAMLKRVLLSSYVGILETFSQINGVCTKAGDKLESMPIAVDFLCG